MRCIAQQAWGCERAAGHRPCFSMRACPKLPYASIKSNSMDLFGVLEPAILQRLADAEALSAR